MNANNPKNPKIESSPTLTLDNKPLFFKIKILF